MRPRSLLFFAISVSLPLLGCAADDGFRTRLAEGCRSERECAELAAQADARAGICERPAGPGVVRLRLDFGSSPPPCDEVDEDRRVARSYLVRYTRERELRAARAKQQKAARRREERALRQEEEQERQRAASEAEAQQREADREARAKAAVEAPRSTPVMPTAPEARDPITPATPAAPTVTAPAPASPQESSGRVCCCDGTLSPTCSTVHRGCCSHHGGVCACE